MTQHIFQYISELLLDFFSNASIQSGDRFHIRYEQDLQVRSQYTALKALAENPHYECSIIHFKFNDYTSYAIKFKNYRLIVSANVDNVAEDFLTGLRNRIGQSDDPAFKEAAILFIHNTSLDSIVNGCKSLSERGMPLNVHEVRESIAQKIRSNETLANYERILLNVQLEKAGQSIDAYSLFDYAVFLELIAKGKVADKDYAKLGLFKDKELKKTTDSKEIKKRLNRNEMFFEEVSHGKQYGNLEKKLEKHFSQNGVNKLQKDDWERYDFTDLEKWREEKKNSQNVEYVKNPHEFTEDAHPFWDRPEGKSVAKSRKRHLIVFNNDQRESINLSLHFNGLLKKEGLDLGSFQNDELNTSGNSIKASFRLEGPNQLTFKHCAYSHPNFSAKFSFLIMVVPFGTEVLQSLKPFYLIKKKRAQFWLEVASGVNIELNKGKLPKLSDKITNGKTYELLEGQSLGLQLESDDDDISEALIEFSVQYLKAEIPFRLAFDAEKPKYISGLEVWNKKRQKQESFSYNERYDKSKDKKVILITQGTHVHYPVDEFRNNLQIESQLIASGNAFHYQTSDGLLLAQPVDLDEDLTKAYNDLIAYYDKNDSLPSLAYLDEELAQLMTRVVDLFTRKLMNLEEGQPLSSKARELFKLGLIEEQQGDQFVKFTPLHPIVMAYQLLFNQKVIQDDLPAYLLNRLSPLNLVPYLKGKKNGSEYTYYQPFEQEHSAEWLYFFNDQVNSQQVSRQFVPKLICEKIEEFVKHFEYLFLDPKRAVMKINLINQGDCKEVLQGIFNYFAKLFPKNGQLNTDQALAFQVNIYGSSNFITKFEELSSCEDIDMVKQEFDITLKVEKEVQEDLVDLFNRKVFFSNKKTEKDTAGQPLYEYAHLSFYQFSNQQISRSSNNMEEVPTGISLDGLISDVPSIYQNDSYRNGFGTNYLSEEHNDLLTLTKRYNAYVHVAHSDDQFKKENAVASVVNKETSYSLESLYKKSQWVTFINPQVDLSFFKSHKEVVIIHYSDQYNNASGYDAITVTSKWKPYEATIKEILSQHRLQFKENDVLHLIDMFNAINGHWLLKLNAYKDDNNAARFREEKLSLLSAVKTTLAIYDHPAITWIPISLEEILRVSGAVGLAQKDGLFSVINLDKEGKHADDLLLIGLEPSEGKLLMHLCPIEVKIGKNDAGVYTKAVEQGQKTAQLLHEYLVEDQTFKAAIYRNFFAKLALIGAQKLALYNIWPEYQKKWQAIEAMRKQLLNDDFLITDQLHSVIGQFGVLSFKASEEYVAREMRYENKGCIMTFTQADAISYLTKNIQELKLAIQNGEVSPIVNEKLLSHRYERNTIVSETPERTEDIAESIAPSITKKVEKPSFNNITSEMVQGIYYAINNRLEALGVVMKKQLAPDINFIEGPAFYRIEVKPGDSTPIKKIHNNIEEINIVLQLPEEQSVRIFSDMGKIWIEAPKKDHQKVKVTTQHIWSDFERKDDFLVPFGVDIEGNVRSVNFSSSNSPHLLLAGTTGSGKSVVLDTLIRGAAHFYDSSELQMFLIDPKGNELIDFEDFPHVPEPNGNSSDEAVKLLERCVEEMDRRYNAFTEIRHQAGRAAKDILAYNAMVRQHADKMPRWLVVLDEYSDLLDENPDNKAVIETLLRRLAQKARAAGIHVIVATQKPLASIVSSAIKSNLPGVIALKVRTAGDSRVILDENGAETLAGKGDALFKNGAGQMTRIQCAIFEHEDSLMA